MWPLSRDLATRLRRFVTPGGTPIVGPSADSGAHQPLHGWQRLDRFLVAEGASQSASGRARELSHEDARSALPLIGQHGVRVVDRTLELFESGRATSSGPVLFILSVAHSVGDATTRKAALQAIVRVTRAGTLRVPAGALRPGRHWRRPTGRGRA